MRDNCKGLRTRTSAETMSSVYKKELHPLNLNRMDSHTRLTQWHHQLAYTVDGRNRKKSYVEVKSYRQLMATERRESVFTKDGPSDRLSATSGSQPS